MPLKVFDFECECGNREDDKIVETGEIVRCPCGFEMRKLPPRMGRVVEGAGYFQPFWSDTFQMRVRDRLDLQKLKEMRKDAGLTCIGHNRGIKPDRAAIRHNYESPDDIDPKKSRAIQSGQLKT